MSSIDDKYRQCGGERGFLGRPIGPEGKTPDGRGRFRHFEKGSIYATAETGAHEVRGTIRDKWAELGWEASFLGYPTSDEMPTPDGRGRYSRFQGGTITWMPETGLTVRRKSAPAGSCSISGKAYGPAAGMKSVFLVSLHGPGDRSRHRETTHFDASGRYRFSGLPMGQYWITIESKVNVHVEPYPYEREVFCTGGPVTDVDFQLR
jgi:hypothetical protein